jgi:predicted DNA repair protein MutK
MAFSLLALLDDISVVLDDVAVMAKIAARKTAGVLGDDLALTAQQVFGVRAKRELPVVLSVAKGSLINKLILIPGALLLSYFVPWLINPLLMIGGAYLCAEGGEKIIHYFIHGSKGHSESELEAELESVRQTEALSSPTPATQTPTAETPTLEAASPDAASPEALNSEASALDAPPPNAPNPAALSGLSLAELESLEKKKISGAIKTDFVLSTEIIVIALGSLKPDISLALRAVILVLVGLAMTGGVYGVVAFIVKLDDIGYWLVKKRPDVAVARTFGNGLILAAPVLMKALTVIGTAAMFMVGGGILVHGIKPLAHLLETWPVWPLALQAIFGLLAGLVLQPIILGLETLYHKIKKPKNA